MKLFVWRKGWLGALNVAMANTVEEAKSLLRSSSGSVGEDSIDNELNEEPEVFEAGKSFTVWADVYDIDESKP